MCEDIIDNDKFKEIIEKSGNAFHKLEDDLALVDCPGFYDVRGQEMQIAVGASMFLLSKMCKTVRGLVIILSW